MASEGAAKSDPGEEQREDIHPSPAPSTSLADPSAPLPKGEKDPSALERERREAQELQLFKEIEIEKRRLRGDIKDLNLSHLIKQFTGLNFDAWTALTTLYKYPVKAVHDFICNQFYELESNPQWLADFEYYLPQLCHLAVAFPKESKTLMQYLMDLCTRSIHFALRISWLFAALASPPFASSPTRMLLETNERCAEFRLKSELACMNGRRPESHPTGGPSGAKLAVQNMLLSVAPSLSPLIKSSRSAQPKAESDIDPDLAVALAQKERADYFKTTQNVIERLAAVSDSLRAVPLPERNAALDAELTALNARLQHPAHGALLYLPADGVGESTAFLLRITPGEALVLNSRDRAPYLLYLETVAHPSGATPASPFLPSYGKELGRLCHPKDRSKIIRAWTSGEKVETGAKADTWVEPTALPRPEGEPVASPPAVREGSSTDAAAAPPTPTDTAASSPPPTSVVGEQSPRKHRQSILWRRESWSDKQERIRAASPYGYLKHWRLRSLIVKFGDDCRQERLALQLIAQFHKIWKKARLPLYVLPYDILIISPVACLIETVVDSKSIHQLKKELNGLSLLDYFTERYGPVNSQEFREAQCAFIDSVAGYSLLTFLLQIKDRHNGNILIRDSGHLVHIDFGFMLSNSPGSLNFESAPFKLPAEYVELMGGRDSPMWEYFKTLMRLGFSEVRKHHEEIVGLVSMMKQVCVLTGTVLPGLDGTETLAESLKERFFLGLNDKELIAKVDQLIEESADNSRTRQYDKFQYYSNGILY